MNENVDVAARLFGWLDHTMVPMLSGSLERLVELITAPIGAAVMLSFVLWAMRYIKENQPITDLIWEYFKLVVVMSFALNAAYFSSTIIPMVNGIPEDIAFAFSENSENAENIIDSMIGNISATISSIWAETKTVTWSGIKVDNIVNGVFATVVVGGMGGIYVGLSLLVLFVAKLVINVILALGPIFIACAFFSSTRNYFTLWINQLVNYMLLAVLFSVMFAVQHALISDIVTVDPEVGGLTDDALIKMFVTYLVSIGTIAVIPTLASSLSGGMGLNGVVGGTGNVASMIAGKPLATLARAMKGSAGNLGSNKITSLNPHRRPG